MMMTNDINDDMRVLDLNVRQLKNLLSMLGKCDTAQTTREKRLVYGMSGIASLFNCSYTTAWRIKRSGIIDDAISQSGRTIVCDADKALSLFNKRK